MATSSGFASKSFENFGVSREELARQHFEPQLARIGLSVEQIENQSLEELNQSLVKVNDTISHPDGFGTLHIKMSADVAIVLTQ